MGGLTGVSDGTALPTLKLPAGAPFVVRNFFADFKRHDLGDAFDERNYEGTFQQQFITEPLSSLVLFPPDDTASTLQPMLPVAEHFPQNGHGAIALTALFNDPTDPE